MPKLPFVTKICPNCGLDKPRSEYYKKVGDLVSYRCKPCTLKVNRARAPQYIGKYSEYQNEWRRKRYETDPAFRQRISEQKAAAYANRKDEINRQRRDRWETDPDNPARLYFRRKDVKRCTPPWVDKVALLKIYATCPPDHEVDHIIPLKGLIDGRPVSGLHVPWNLQHLPTKLNRKKYNRVSERDIAVKR